MVEEVAGKVRHEGALHALEDAPEVLRLLVVEQPRVAAVLAEPGAAPVALHLTPLAAAPDVVAVVGDLDVVQVCLVVVADVVVVLLRVTG